MIIQFFNLFCLVLFLLGCSQHIPNTVKSGVGVYAGTRVVEAVRQANEALKPEYKLLVEPLEICNFREDVVECSIVPCETKCDTEYSYSEFVDQHPAVVTLDSSLFVNAVEYCERNNWEPCINFIGEYRDKTLLLKKVD